MVGKSFSIFSKKRWQGIGSERLLVVGAKGKLAQIFQDKYRQNFANIELRPGGIIVRIRYRLEVYGLVIPYRHLTLFKSNKGEITIFDQAEKVTLRNYQGRALNKGFLNKLLTAKAEYQPDNL